MMPIEIIHWKTSSYLADCPAVSIDLCIYTNKYPNVKQLSSAINYSSPGNLSSSPFPVLDRGGSRALSPASPPSETSSYQVTISILVIMMNLSIKPNKECDVTKWMLRLRSLAAVAPSRTPTQPIGGG